MTMMTRAHFKLIADTIASLDFPEEDGPEIEICANEFARVLARTNPQFDRAKFLKVCGVSDTP